MRIILADTAGFCFGVSRAVGLAYEYAEKGCRCHTLGPLIHNADVTEDLNNRGVSVINSPDEAKNGDVVIIRAHGVSPEQYKLLREKGAEICDATCPFVKKIHDIVLENSSNEIPVLIAGDISHPEVIGIRGHCKGASYVFSSEAELLNILDINPQLKNDNVTVVSQTTFSDNEWKKCREILTLYCTKLKIFDTICSATRKRQEEAQKLSKSSDAMIVIGGRHSSNTVKLFNLCRENCDTFLVERASELKNIDFSTYTNVGVTAGASTPAVIIKEVLLAMSEINETKNTQVEEVPSVAADNEDFATLLNDNLEKMDNDPHVIGTVMGITPTEIKVDIGRKHTGFIPADEYSADPNAKPEKELKIGDELDLIIMKTNDAEGTVMLSKKRFDAQKSWVDIVAAKEEGTVLEGTVSSVIKGGILVTYKGSNVFVPASLATEHKDDALEDLVKQTVNFKIIDVDVRRKRAVGSIRVILNEKKKENSEAFWAAAEEGKTYSGVVKSLTNYGAFVDIGGVDGMVHISEMSWKRIKHPSDVLTVGQEIEVFIKSLDAENKKISLGYRKDEDNPWAILEKNYPEGTVVEAEIVGLTTFGAFAKVIPGIDGLIHISQIANKRINKPEEILKVGDKVTCKITGIDFDKKRVSLSIRALLPEVEETAEEAAEEVAEEVVEETTEAADAE